MLNIAVWPGGAAPPFDPQLLAPLPGQRGGRETPPPKPRWRCPPADGRTVMVTARVNGAAEYAAYEVAASDDGADANVDLRLARALRASEAAGRAPSAMIATNPPLGEQRPPAPERGPP